MKIEDMPENRCKDHKETELDDTCFYCEELYNLALSKSKSKDGLYHITTTNHTYKNNVEWVENLPIVTLEETTDYPLEQYTYCGKKQTYPDIVACQKHNTKEAQKRVFRGC